MNLFIIAKISSNHMITLQLSEITSCPPQNKNTFFCYINLNKFFTIIVCSILSNKPKVMKLIPLHYFDAISQHVILWWQVICTVQCHHNVVIPVMTIDSQFICKHCSHELLVKKKTQNTRDICSLLYQCSTTLKWINEEIYQYVCLFRRATHSKGSCVARNGPCSPGAVSAYGTTVWTFWVETLHKYP